jgi:hypothetical protein
MRKKERDKEKERKRERQGEREKKRERKRERRKSEKKINSYVQIKTAGDIAVMSWHSSVGSGRHLSREDGYIKLHIDFFVHNP